MEFVEILTQVLELLQRQGRLSYGALKRRFHLDDEYLQDLKDELIDAQRVARDEDGKVLVWVGNNSLESRVQSLESQPVQSPNPVLPAPVPQAQVSLVEGSKVQSQGNQTLDPRRQTLDATAERRQLTVMFCDLVGSTALSTQLDPEELREVIQAYRETCAIVIRRFDGYLAKYIGDGLLVYFGYPVAHEDDAQRAVRAGLEIVVALQNSSPARHEVPSPLAGEGQGEGGTSSIIHTPHPNPFPQGKKELRRLQVRIGIHTGLVVAGEMGTEDQPEHLAIVGETPNLAARIQGQAEPNEVVISTATYRLVEGLFECEDRGQPELKGVSTPLTLYRVVKEGEAQSRFEVAARKGLTPLIGRDHEFGLLRERWAQAKSGEGQVVLLSGEPGIGKSRLVQELKEQVVTEEATRIEFRCSPYHQNSAFYPIVEHLQRLLQFQREERPHAKLAKLHQALVAYRFPQADTLPLFATLLSLPQPDGIPQLTLSPQKQKQKTQAALVAWLMEEAEKAAMYCAWEDLHWADPSTLEVLTLLLDQVPTTRLLAVLTFRPEFTPPWGNRSYLSQMTLSRLGRQQVGEMINLVLSQTARPSTSSGRTESESKGEKFSVRAEPVEARVVLPSEIVQQIVSKTDGVPLFVEELTKSVVESVGSIESIESRGRLGRSSIPLGIPTTLQDALMARLDRLGAAKEIAQLGATLGREFSYEVFHAVSPLDEGSLQQGLRQLVEVELLYQRGLPPQATYLFKHALIQDTAYQSLLKSTRQQYHRQIAQVLEEQFLETKESQPELLAHHYTEAALIEQALPYWQKAGERAVQRSTWMEAISHFTKGLELLTALADTPERVQQELTLQLALNLSLAATRGYTAPEVKKTMIRVQELSQQLGETPQLFPALFRLYMFDQLRGEFQTAHELAEQLMRLAQNVQNRYLLSVAHQVLGWTLYYLGELTSARPLLEQAITLYDPQQHPDPTINTSDPRVDCLSFVSWVLWLLGYPDQALKRSQEALALVREQSRPLMHAMALGCAAVFHLFRRDEQLAQELAEEVIALSTEQGFPYWVAVGTLTRGGALSLQGQEEEGIPQLRQGLAALRAMGAEMGLTWILALLAEAHEVGGQVDDGLRVLTEALDVVDKRGERFYEAELYRLAGELSLRIGEPEGGRIGDAENEAENRRAGFSFADSPFRRFSVSSPEECFLKAIDIARKQQAKSLELRATMSLSRLWQQQGKQKEAHQMLLEIYNWFTEGFDTKDLQEAKALLESLGSSV